MSTSQVPPPSQGPAPGAAAPRPATAAPGTGAAPRGASDIAGTLLPHAAGDQVNEFRWAFVGGVVALALLVLGGLIVASIILAALLVPVLYVMYLYEARVYRDAPIPVVGFTFGGGMLLGILVTALANRAVPASPLVVHTSFGDSVDLTGVLVVGLLLPLVKELLKPWPALILRNRPDLTERVDGLVLGIATGLGFALAETLIRFSQLLTARDLDTNAAGWLFPLLSVAIFSPLVGGSTTGLITAAVWRYRRGQPVTSLQVGAIVTALSASVAYAMGTRLLVEFGAPQLVTLGWEVLLVAVLLGYVRVLLSRGLSEEARDLGLPDPTMAAGGEGR